MHPARLVQMCLHFLCHANSEIRSLAVELANILATHPATLYNPFPHLPQWYVLLRAGGSGVRVWIDVCVCLCVCV